MEYIYQDQIAASMGLPKSLYSHEDVGVWFAHSQVALLEEAALRVVPR